MRHLVILAPEGGDLSPFRNVRVSLVAGRQLLHKLQSFRGDCYLRLGALQSHQLDEEGKHVQPQDVEAWHMLSMKENDELAAGLRFVIDSNREFQVGGWCVEEQVRGSRQAFEMLMGAYALAALLGIQRGTATATSSFSKSAEILKRVGGEFVRAYYDENYRSDMEEIRFDLRKRNPRFEKSFERYQDELRHALVIFSPGLRDASQDSEASVVEPSSTQFYPVTKSIALV
jgi:predicted GNAT family N-acyltransferase